MTKRKSIFSLLLIFVLTLVFLSSAFVTPNNAFASTSIFVDIKNPSFEIMTSEEYDKPFPTDWIINEDFEPENIKVISTNAYNKNNYWQFEGGSYTVESKDFIEIENEYDYLFGVKFIFSDVNDSLTLNIKTFDEQGELIGTHQGQTVVSDEAHLDLWQETFLTLSYESSVKKVKISIEIVAQNGFVGIDNVYGYKNFFSLYNGASISLERNVLAIRFTAKVDADSYKTLLNSYENVTAGIIVSPKGQVKKSGEFTMNGIMEKDKIIVMPSSYWNNPQTFEQVGYYEYSCKLASQGYDKLQSNLDINFTVRAYIKYTENGEEKILYSSWSLENNCRSIRQVAIKAKEDLDVYNNYDKDQQEIISAYIEGRVPNFDGLD